MAPRIVYLMEEVNEESISLFSGSNMAPLSKKQTTSKKAERGEGLEEKIGSLGFQVVEEVGVVTPLEVHPSRLSDCITTYRYQRHPAALSEPDFKRRDTKERADFILAITSLFRKATSAPHNKFTVLVPNGLIYLFFEGAQPRLLVASQTGEFGQALQREEIKAKVWRGQEFEREGYILEGQHIRLFFGYLLNWALAKKAVLEVFANFPFDLGLKEVPLAFKHAEGRKEYEHLMLREESCLGERTSKLYFFKFQTICYREDIARMDERLKQLEGEHERSRKGQRISHDFEFKLSKYTLGLDQSQLDRPKATQ